MRLDTLYCSKRTARHKPKVLKEADRLNAAVIGQDYPTGVFVIDTHADYEGVCRSGVVAEVSSIVAADSSKLCRVLVGRRDDTVRPVTVDPVPNGIVSLT